MYIKICCRTKYTTLKTKAYSKLDATLINKNIRGVPLKY